MYLFVTKGYGLTVEDINWSCPADLEPYVNEFRLEEKKIDERNWVLGSYITSSVIVGVDHVLNGRKAKSKYIEKPFMQQAEEQRAKENLSEEEKKKLTEQFFMRLEIMQTNFNLEKQRKNNEGGTA